MERRALQEGMLILNGRYRVVQRLYQRPRLNLYQVQRVQGVQGVNSLLRSRVLDSPEEVEEEPLIVIRELYLEGLSAQMRSVVEAAAGHESFSAAMPGAPLLEVGGRAKIESESHYLIMQLRQDSGTQYTVPLTLSKLLLQARWPTWLTIPMVVHWGSQLCRSVARLHRMGVLLGGLNPACILVDKEGKASWTPMLLISWPPAPQFWQLPDPHANIYEMYDSIFPIAQPGEENVFVAPELYQGYCDERSDVYSLGAILYLLLTRYGPASAFMRLQALQQGIYSREPGSYKLETATGLELTLPRFINPGISPLLEQIILRALEIESTRRYQSVFELVEALEALEQMESQEQEVQLHKDEGMRKLLNQIMGY
jgi:hypothetical protein